MLTIHMIHLLTMPFFQFQIANMHPGNVVCCEFRGRGYSREELGIIVLFFFFAMVISLLSFILG